MEKVEFKSLNIDKIIKDGYYSKVYRLHDGRILKIFSNEEKLLYSFAGTDLEKKITSAKKIENVPEIIVPEMAVYSGPYFYGYISEYVDGTDYNKWDDNLTLMQRTDLEMYAKMHIMLEAIVKRANGKKIIMPDLLTCDNVIITKDNKMKIIDYDGLQIDKFKTIEMSTSLGKQEQYEIPKYSHNHLFTHNLDKKSLIVLYFLQTFNVNLENIGLINNRTGKIITIDDVFETIGLDDDDIKHKVWKCYQKECTNDFLGDDVFRIADKYKMTVYPIMYNNEQHFIKHLYRK